MEQWANGFENYTFEKNNVNTTLMVDLETAEYFVGYMNETYPQAFDKLKEICEK